MFSDDVLKIKRQIEDAVEAYKKASISLDIAVNRYKETVDVFVKDCSNINKEALIIAHKKQLEAYQLKDGCYEVIITYKNKYLGGGSNEVL